METIKVNARINEDGVLRLEIPTHLDPQEVEVIVVLQTGTKALPVDTNGWPVGFFDRTYGALADDPIERPPQPALEERDELE